jgi:hypothetical protein
MVLYKIQSQSLFDEHSNLIVAQKGLVFDLCTYPFK